MTLTAQLCLQSLGRLSPASDVSGLSFPPYLPKHPHKPLQHPSCLIALPHLYSPGCTAGQLLHVADPQQAPQPVQGHRGTELGAALAVVLNRECLRMGEAAQGNSFTNACIQSSPVWLQGF